MPRRLPQRHHLGVPVGSPSPRARSGPVPDDPPRPETTTAPIGTSPVATAPRASSSGAAASVRDAEAHAAYGSLPRAASYGQGRWELTR
jgi:hypothetical protein